MVYINLNIMRIKYINCIFLVENVLNFPNKKSLIFFNLKSTVCVLVHNQRTFKKGDQAFMF